MLGAIMVSHGKLSKGLKDSVEMIGLTDTLVTC